MEAMTLLERTQVLLNQRLPKGDDPRERAQALRAIAENSDDLVQLEWLKKFAAGKIENPGVVTIQSLHDCLQKSSRKRA